MQGLLFWPRKKCYVSDGLSMTQVLPFLLLCILNRHWESITYLILDTLKNSFSLKDAPTSHEIITIQILDIQSLAFSEPGLSHLQGSMEV